MTIVVLSWGEAIEGGTAEALTLAAQLAAATGAELRWAVTAALEPAAAALAAHHGVKRLDVIDAAPKGADAVVAVFAAYCAQHPASTVLVNQSAPARAVAPRLAE